MMTIVAKNNVAAQNAAAALCTSISNHSIQLGRPNAVHEQWFRGHGGKDAAVTGRLLQ